jgi:anaerobic selenocysteine-containing dehydrogenase
LCGICPLGCGVEITKDGERLHQIKPMEGHPLGIVCTRGIHAEEVVYSADRLQSPMKRVGNRGQYGWRRATSTQSVERGQCESTDRPGEPGSYFRVSGI